MTKPGGSLTTKKPTYKNVQWKPLDDPDKFRDADRIEEAQKIPLTDSQRTLLEEENKELKDNQMTKMEVDYKQLLNDAAEASRLATLKDDQLAEVINEKLGLELKHEEEHKLRLDAELETSLVKAIGQNSPEMKALRKEIEELKADLARAREDHQFDNMVHKKELANLAK